MTAIEPNIEDYGRYRVIDVCKALQIHRDTLLKYTNGGLIKCGFRKNGEKFYIGTDVKKYWRGNY